MTPDHMNIPVEWVLGVLIGLGGVIATLAKVIWNVMQSRLAAQDAIIASQSGTISKLQGDVERLSKGCGHDACHWKKR
jgi:hypothetical protein